MSEESSLLVTVVIVSYNGRRYLDACLDSVLDQDFPQSQYDVLVVDNASSDGSADHVEQSYPSVRVMRLDKNYGPGAAVEHALPHIRGRYLGYLNQDAVAHRRWLAELVEAVTSHPRVGLVESNMILPQWPEFQGMRLEGLVERAYVCDITSYGYHDFRVAPVTPETPPIPVLCANCTGAILNPDVIEAIGYLVEPEFFAYYEDMDLGLRMNAADYDVLLAPRSVVYHDTDWHFRWDMRSMRKAFWSVQNTILTFYKISYASEFAVILPRLLMGKLIRAGQHCRSPVCRLAYALAATPMLLLGFASALLKIPFFRKRRQLTLKYRKKEPGWLTERILNPGWESDPSVWKRRRQL